MKDELLILLKSQYPLIHLVTPEEERAERVIADLAQKELNRNVYVWTITRGLIDLQQKDNQNPVHSNTKAIDPALNWIIAQKNPGVYVLKDFHPYVANPEVTRLLRDAIREFKNSDKSIVLLSPFQMSIPPEIEKDIVVLDLPLPSVQELEAVLDRQLAVSRQRRLSPEAKEKLVRAVLGLTHDEAEKVYRKAYVSNGRLTEQEVDIVLSEKQQIIRRNGILEYLAPEEGMNDVGGLEELKGWLQKRANAFSQKARAYGLPQPKGILLLGVPGCGKSLIARTTAQLWSLPLIRLDVGRVYDGSMVGRSEANLRGALRVAESLAPVILFIDEIDKAFAGGGSSADSDGGTSSRIFGTFLTWMQDKKSPVFVMATANRIDRLPAEFLRKGRFDELFFIDLPSFKEREEIFRIHLKKRRQDISRFDVAELAANTDGYSGAEIEQAVIAAMYEAFAQDREFGQLDIVAAIKSTTPLSRTMTEQMSALRDWARMRARPAAAPVAEYQRLEF